MLGLVFHNSPCLLDQPLCFQDFELRPGGGGGGYSVYQWEFADKMPKDALG